MKAGKAVYCEKPIDLEIAKVQAVVQDAAQTDVPILVGFRRRFLPAYQAIRQSIQNGDVGRLEAIHMISRDFKPPAVDYINVSGGFLRDKTIHYFDLICWLTGERPTEVYAAGACLVDPAIGEAGDVDSVMLILRMPSGALCHIENSRRAIYGFDERIEVFGALGMLQSKPLPATQVARFSATGILQDRYPDLYGQESFAATLDAFIAAVETSTPVEPSLMDGLQAQLIAEAAAESLETNKPVTISYWLFRVFSGCPADPCAVMQFLWDRYRPLRSLA